MEISLVALLEAWGLQGVQAKMEFHGIHSLQRLQVDAALHIM